MACYSSGGGSPLLLVDEDDNDTMSHVLCKALKALLERDEIFAQAFLRDRSTFERIVKMITTGGHQQCGGAAGTMRPHRHNTATTTKNSMVMLRVQRSAGLHCIVLAFRLTRMDDYAAETCLPVLIAGALSGVIEYPSGERKEEDFGTTRSTSSSNDKHVCTSSSQLSSAQELVSHAIVNPLVGPVVFANIHEVPNLFDVLYTIV